MAKLVVLEKKIKSFFFQKCHQFWVMTNKVTFSTKKKYLFRKMSLHKLFQGKLLICTQNQNRKNGGKFYLKAEGQTISEHSGLTLWPRNLGKKWFCKLRQSSFTATQKCTFWSTSGHKTISYHEKIKTMFQMTYTIRMVRPRQFIEPG